MDGTRDRPPGKTAQNWGRRDGIRAGAVSGPWRSAPRASGAAQQRLARAEAEAGAAAADTDLAPTREVEAYERARARRSMATRAWLIFGVVAATSIVVAAVVFRPNSYQPVPDGATASVGVPEPPPEIDDSGTPIAAAPEAPAVPVPVAPADDSVLAAPPETETAAAAPAPAIPELAGITSVRLRVGPGFPSERQDAIVAALTEAGVPAVKVEPLPFEIATSRVGYYRPEDLAAAEALGRLVSPVLGEASDLGVRDYGQLLSEPEPGRLDLWVGD